MNFKSLNIKISYITYGENNIRNALIVPALGIAKTYKRSVGFFSTSVFDTILDGVVELARNNGHIQIIASPQLSQSDIEAITLGYETRELIIKSAFLRNFDQAVERLESEKLKLAAQLIAKGVLDIKITDLLNELPEIASDGSYHDKLGILEDPDGNSIVFVGSPNETINGMKKNYEKVRVFKSWNEVQNEYVKDETEEFEMLWKGLNPYLKTYEFGQALAEHILQIKENREAQHKSAATIVLRDYQQEAVDAWVANNYHGFFVMATGTGKTWTAIFAAKELIKQQESLIVICAPYKHLVRQWSEDVAAALPEARIILVSSENANWEHELTDTVVRERLHKGTQVVVISTITSFNLDRFTKTIRKSKQRKLLIVDEAHRFTKRQESLKEEYRYMLGLSATPFNGKNAAKGRELMEFFGGQVYNLPIENALERKFLVPYYYYPIFVSATDEEEQRFRQLSAKIAGCFRNGRCIDPDNLVKYVRSRLRIISMAQEKIDRIDEILSKIKETNHFIVYCGDGRLFDDDNEEIRHIQFVKRKLSSHGFKASQFTASENIKDRMELVEMFNAGEISSLAAIRCLDEGINIPSIQGALILSSNDDYREFVQRRGRILRLYDGKQFANIYDVIVVPSYGTPGLATIEFRRYYEYARLAINTDETIAELENLIAEFGITIDDISTTVDEIVEDDIDE